MNQNVTEIVQNFFSQYPSHKFKKGDILIPAETEPKGIFYIESGIVRSYWISKDGSEITLNMYKSHTFLPMSWAISGVKNTNFYEAITPVTTRLAPKNAVLDFLQKEPTVVYDLLQRIYIGMEGLWMHIESIASGNAYIKLIASILILAKRFGKQEKGNLVIQLHMNEQDIANYSGITRETASRELQKLKKDNLVAFEKGVIIIKDLQRMESLLLH